MKKIICALALCTLFVFSVSAEVLPAFEFEQDSVEQLVDSGEITLNNSDFGYELSDQYADKGKSLKLSFKKTGAEESFKGIRFDLPIYCRDLSLKEGVCFYVRTPEIAERPRYVEFKLQFDMPSRAQAVAGQTIYMTQKGGKTTESQVRDGNVIRVDSKFEGYVWVPFYAFQSTGGATLRRDQFMRMYIYADCDYFSGRELWLDSIGFYQKSDMPEVTENLPPLPTLPGDTNDDNDGDYTDDPIVDADDEKSSDAVNSEEMQSSEPVTEELESSRPESTALSDSSQPARKDGVSGSAVLWIVLGSIIATAIIVCVIVLMLIKKKKTHNSEE